MSASLDRFRNMTLTTLLIWVGRGKPENLIGARELTDSWKRAVRDGLIVVKHSRVNLTDKGEAELTAARFGS